MEKKHYTVSAFTFDKSGGNLAGVVLDSDDLADEEMQKIAKQLNFSETAFVLKSDVSDFKVRFFTPNSEVDLCGHATIATFHLLKHLKLIGSGNFTQETKAGVLKIKIENDLILMEQNSPKFFDKLNCEYTEKIVSSLNIKKEDLDDKYPLQIVSTGLKDILIPVKNNEVLNSIKPNFSQIKSISSKLDAVGYHVFSTSVKDDISAYCRNFAPLYDIDEESATGTSNGALSAYLYKYEGEKVNEYKFIQGVSMNNTSLILGKIISDKGNISGVWVGGYAEVVS
ncbi:PhzF family phenazine biosynthesis protein [Helicovermis profundi]|uniref:PhzF family phenazine biosynthesis protein n=1 Tax=Helicovermis profundi TaxID=3065157 RepID=A0AAU9EK91_9FIRM|nr:PhzF family phenazine biosynthesis protein [Clostridia bacterium S502]